MKRSLLNDDENDLLYVLADVMEQTEPKPRLLPDWMNSPIQKTTLRPRSQKRVKSSKKTVLSEGMTKALAALADSTYEDDERCYEPETLEFLRRLMCAFVEHGFREPDHILHYHASCAAASFSWNKPVDAKVSFHLGEPSVTLLISTRSGSHKWMSDDTPFSAKSVSRKWTSDDIGTPLISAKSVSYKWWSRDIGTPPEPDAMVKLISAALRVEGIANLYI